MFDVWPDTERSWADEYGRVATTGIPRVFDIFHRPTKGWYRSSTYRPTESPSQVCVISRTSTSSGVPRRRPPAKAPSRPPAGDLPRRDPHRRRERRDPPLKPAAPRAPGDPGRPDRVPKRRPDAAIPNRPAKSSTVSWVSRRDIKNQLATLGGFLTLLRLDLPELT